MQTAQPPPPVIQETEVQNPPLPEVYSDSSPEPHHHQSAQQLPPQQTSMSMASMAYSQPSVLPPVSKAPYSVNGISLSAPNVDLMHPAMGYPPGE